MDQPFGPDGEGGASHYRIDPYGAAIHNITTALEEGFKHHGGMSGDEFSVLGMIAEQVQETDPHCAFGVPPAFKHKDAATTLLELPEY